MSAYSSISGEAQRRTRSRRWFPQDYKDQVVAWYFATGKPVAQLAEELALPESTLRDWIRRAKRAAESPDAAAEDDVEIAWHGEPEEAFVTSLPHRADATWVFSPARLEALLAETPPIAEIAYKLGLSEPVLKAWVRSAAGELETTTTVDTEAAEVVPDPEPITEAVALEPEDVRLEPEEPAPPVVTEAEGGPWTLVWRPPAEGQSTVNTTEWVHASGWTPSQARSAALSLLGNPDSDAGIEVEFLQVPRHRLAGRIYVRARRTSAE